MKFMQIADVHLGAKPDEGKPWSQKRQQDIWDTFRMTLDFVKQQEVEILFITGDLFHRQPLKRELKEVSHLFAQLPDTKIFLQAGNHDYLQPQSGYGGYPWEGNVYFFPRETVTGFDFPEENLTVYGNSYWHREIKERTYDSLVPKNPERMNVLLVHGGDEKHQPFSPGTILSHGFDYVAAGHIHKGGQLVEGKVVMAGALEPIDCNDTGPHGFWMGELNKQGSQVHFFPVKKCEYYHETLCVTKDTTNFELLEQAKERMAELPEYGYVRFLIRGYADPEMVFDISPIAALERVVDITSDVRPDFDYEKLRKENPNALLGTYIRHLEEGPQNVVTQKALEYGVSALLGYPLCR